MRYSVIIKTISVLLAALSSLSIQAQTTQFVDFENGTWDHGGIASTGWDSSEVSGTYTMGDGNSVTMNVSFHGSAVAASGNLSIIDEWYFSGFAFQALPSGSTNSGSLANYERVDFEFDQPVLINEFIIMDVDRDSWDDVLLVEGWLDNGGVGTLGSGITSTYGFRNTTNLDTETIFGETHVTVASGANTVSGSESDMLIDFSQAVDAISLYYWNGDYGSTASTQTIGIAGNGITVTTVPEPVPEPSSVLLMISGLSALLLRRHRR
ncbi:MAG: PEP-CTERM sorting domain-containing protein [Akkermansiaceae bacterium]